MDAFISNVKKHIEAPEPTHEMCYELIARIVIGEYTKVTGVVRAIDIVYKSYANK